MAVLKVSPDLSLSLDLATEALAILGKRGSGKSNAAVVLFEEMHRAGVPCVAVDPKGDWYGLRSSSDGRSPGLPIPVFGGRHGDVPLDPSAGAYLADLVIDRRLSCVVDVSELSRADAIRFLTAFGQRLYRQAQDEPMHLFLEECHEYLPQRVGPAEAQMVGAWQKLVKQGRFKGLGCTLISQRSAAVNKDVLNQAEVLVAMRVLAPHDRAAVKGWVEVHGEAEEVVRSLAELADGEAWIWAPELLGAPRRMRFRRRSTFDSGATPKVGQARRAPATLAEVDLAAIKEAMAESIERAKADDPAELRRQVGALERQLAARDRAVPEPVVERVEVEVPVVPAQALIAYDRLKQLVGEVDGALEMIGQALRGSTPVLLPRPVAPEPKPRDRAETPSGERAAPPVVPPPEGLGKADRGLGKADRAILTVLAQYPEGVRAGRLALLAGYSPRTSTVRSSLALLRAVGYVRDGQPVTVTPLGLAALGEWEPLPRGRELLDYWMGRLGKAEREVLSALLAAYPAGLSPQAIAGATGYSPRTSTLRSALASLRRLELVVGRAVAPDFAEAIGA